MPDAGTVDPQLTQGRHDLQVLCGQVYVGPWVQDQQEQPKSIHTYLLPVIASFNVISALKCIFHPCYDNISNKM